MLSKKLTLHNLMRLTLENELRLGLKSVNHIGVLDAEREKQLKDMYRYLSEKYALSLEFVWYVFSFIIEHLKALQKTSG